MSTETTAAAGKYLTFALADESYGLPVLKVREIITLMDVTPVPRVPAYVKGVINLRGKVIPVIDLRLFFGLDTGDSTDAMCIIVVEAIVSGRSGMFGVVVDCVSEVLQIAAGEIEPPPDLCGRLGTRHIVGMAKVKGDVKMLLDLDDALSARAA